MRLISVASLMREFLLRVEVLPWDGEAVAVYGDLRASCAASGITLGALDMMIAAHAVATRATLVAHDKAFALVPGALAVEDWIIKTNISTTQCGRSRWRSRLRNHLLPAFPAP